MKAISLARSLAAHPFLSDLEESAVDFLTSCTKNQRFGQGEYLLREGHSADSLYLLRQGTVDLECYGPKMGCVAVERLHAGEALGVSVAFAPCTWSTDARATSDVLAFVIDGPCLRRKLDADAPFARAVLRHLLADTHTRLQRAHIHMLDIYKAELAGTAVK